MADAGERVRDDGSGSCCSAPTPRWSRPPRPPQPSGSCSASRPPTSPGSSWCRCRRWPPGSPGPAGGCAGAVRAAVRADSTPGCDRRRRRLPRLHRRLRAGVGARSCCGPTSPARAIRLARLLRELLPGRVRARRAAGAGAAPALAPRRRVDAAATWCCCPTRTAAAAPRRDRRGARPADAAGTAPPTPTSSRR